jgi:hypothetical protein
MKGGSRRNRDDPDARNVFNLLPTSMKGGSRRNRDTSLQSHPETLPNLNEDRP